MVLAASFVHAQTTGNRGIPLIEGQSLGNFYTFHQTLGKNNDPSHIFKVDPNDVLHIFDLEDMTKPQEYGYLATNEEFRNYAVRLEYKWGAKKFPRADYAGPVPRDTGLLYDIAGDDGIWPKCIEFQIREHDTGDAWLLGGNPRPAVLTTVATTQPASPGAWQFQYGGTPMQLTGQRVVHRAEYESLTDWNKIELLVTGDEAVYVVNGHVSNILKQIRDPQTGKPMNQGRIAIQSEAAEVLFRNLQIRPQFMTGSGPGYKVLVFSKTAGFRHASIPDGIAAVKKLGEEFGFGVDATEESAGFTDENLKQYKTVVFMSTTGDVLNDTQQAAFERYIRAGGGFVGVHAASDTEYDWPWYGKLVGAYFSKHPSGTPKATVRLDDPDNPLISSLPLSWTRNDEWYNFRSNPRKDVHVLASLDESTYQGGTMNGDHPITWYHDFEGGRSWYTAMGHTKESFTDPLFLMQLLGGIEYAAGRSSLPPPDAMVLFDGKDASHWVDAKGNPIAWPVHDGVMESKTRAGDIFTKEKFDDFQLHVEFKVPATNPAATANEITNEQARGNSGVYMQGRYEAQILDSFDHPLKDMNDEGAIYGIKDADVNASMPAESWQRYDITFHAPKWNGTQKTANARATVYLNGLLVQNDVEIPHATQSGQPEAPGPGAIMLQDHLNPVQFRNIWIREMK